MLRYVMDTLLRLCGKRSKKSLPRNPLQIVRLPRSVVSTHLDERLTYYRRLRAAKCYLNASRAAMMNDGDARIARISDHVDFDAAPIAREWP